MSNEFVIKNEKNLVNEIFLTIGIPTYNGEDTIEGTLNSIVNALEIVDNHQIFEVIVSDNRSLDKTSEIAKKYMNTKFNFKYYCNAKNEGYDTNLDLIVERANGKYVWFIGCSEIVDKDSLKNLIKKIVKDIDYTNILLDYEVYDEIESKITQRNVRQYKEDFLIEGKNNFRINRYDMSVSSNIINKKKWQSSMHIRLIVEGWCHIERIINMISLEENSKTLFLCGNYYTWYKEKNGWWTKINSFDYYFSLIKVINSMIGKGYREDVVQHLIDGHSRKSLFMSILLYKRFGWKTTNKMSIELIKLHKKDYFFWIFIFPLLIMPNKLLFIPNLLLKLLSKIKNVK